MLSPTGGGGRVKPIANGQFYFGEIDKDPVTNPIQVYYKDETQTEIPIDQPIRTNNSGAFVANDGQTLINPYTKELGHSTLVLTSTGETIYLDEHVGDPGNIASEIPNYTDIVYKASGGNSAVGNMIAENPLSSAIGDILKTGGTTWERYNDDAPITIENFRAFNCVYIKDFGAKLDGITDDTLAYQSAISAAVTLKIGVVYHPSGTAMITDTPELDTGDFSQGIRLVGDGNTSIINQTGVGKDAIHFSKTQFLANSGIENMKIITQPVAGHCVNFVFGTTGAYFKNVDMTCLNPDKHCWFGDWTSSVDYGGIFDTVWEGGSWYLSGNHNSNGMRFICRGTVFNENTIRNVRPYNSPATNEADAKPWISIEQTQPTVWLNNNKFTNINFEVCKGGGIYIESPRNNDFDGISMWDTPVMYGDGISFGTGSGYAGTANKISRYTRQGGSLSSAAIADIRIGTAQETVLSAIGGDGGGRIDFNGKRAVMLGYSALQRDNDQQVAYLSGLEQSLTSSVKVKDRLTMDQTYNGSYIKDETTTGLLIGTEANGGLIRLLFNGDAFYPINSGVVSCGKPGGLWSEVFAINGAINTSDERFKKMMDITDAERECALEIKSVIKKFKWNDAITEKGEENARIHFGVGAQTVGEIFRKHGLNPDEYSLFCYNEWEDEVVEKTSKTVHHPDIFDDSGVKISDAYTEVIPNEVEVINSAGNRYGIRYTELLMFIISAI